MPIYECTTLDRFKSPPCQVPYVRGNQIQVCCPETPQICFPGQPWCDPEELKKQNALECRTNDFGMECCKNDKGEEDCYPLAEPYKCDSNNFIQFGQYPEYVIPEEYQGEFPEYPAMQNEDSTCQCLPLSKCILQDILNSTIPPTLCKFSRETGEDYFCCNEGFSGSSKVPGIPQSPIYKTINGQPWPCADHTDQCQQWINDHPDSCSPQHESYGFMKLACMESCKICEGHVSK